MSESFDFTHATAVVPGAVGEPGRRTFFVQAHTDEGIVSFKLEKQQVAALCEYFDSVLEDLPDSDIDAEESAIAAMAPTEMQWSVGGLGVAWDEEDERLIVVAEELLLDDEGGASDERSAATARFHLSRSQIVTFVGLGNDLVQAGRPACRLCGRPIDVDGHTCPRLN